MARLIAPRVQDSHQVALGEPFRSKCHEGHLRVLAVEAVALQEVLLQCLHT